MGYYGKLAKHGCLQVFLENYLDFQVFGGAFHRRFGAKNIE